MVALRLGLVVVSSSCSFVRHRRRKDELVAAEKGDGRRSDAVRGVSA